MRDLNFSCTNVPHAPLADAFEVDDFLLNDAEQCYNLQFTDNTNGIDKIEEKMEQDEMDMPTDLVNDDSFSESDSILNREDEYPELTRTCGESAVESESYDFTVMDTEKDMNGGNRKRKADNSATSEKKRVK
ncbi:Chitinase domain-containing protein [Dirofilaria immitis]